MCIEVTPYDTLSVGFIKYVTTLKDPLDLGTWSYLSIVKSALASYSG